MTPETKSKIISNMRQTWEDCGMDILSALGKKSVTKAELKDFVMGNVYDIPEMKEFDKLSRKEKDAIFNEAFPNKYYGY